MADENTSQSVPSPEITELSGLKPEQESAPSSEAVPYKVGYKHPPRHPIPPGPGAPRGPRFMTRIDKFMRLKSPDAREAAIKKFFPKLKGKLSAEDAVAAIFTIKAMSGDSWAVLEYFNRKEGKVPQPLDHTNKGGKFGNEFDDFTDEEIEHRLAELRSHRSKAGNGITAPQVPE